MGAGQRARRGAEVAGRAVVEGRGYFVVCRGGYVSVGGWLGVVQRCRGCFSLCVDPRRIRCGAHAKMWSRRGQNVCRSGSTPRHGVPRLGVDGFVSRVGLGGRLTPRCGGGTPRHWVFR
ncbi:hypothetical protein PIB30_074443 [Stylosanthes scabra]|uniref:Uncharacterized protein n=1 Tax=Stylosanthes scabra TaxID=79078 RepID=A0ABU6YR07_9FABA|nr:hypothetical protein [Stylosanthes scabra]